MHKQVRYCDKAANHQLPKAVAFWIIWIVSVEEYSNLMQNLMQIWRFVALPAQSFWMQWPHSACAHAIASTAPTNKYSEVIIVHTCAFQSTLLASRLHWCCTNCSHCINNGWAFSGQTSYMCVYITYNTYYLVQELYMYIIYNVYISYTYNNPSFRALHYKLSFSWNYSFINI